MMRVLVALELSDFAIIDTLRLELSPGLNVLTGETGAGKSILIDALALLIGGRADTSFIRTGCKSALVQGLFSHDGLESASRRLQNGGRNNARLNGEVVSIGELSEIGANLIAIHGQHASQTLMDARAQRRLLDRLLDKKAAAELERYRAFYSDYTRTAKELENLKTATRERARRLDVLAFQTGEIDAAKLKPGEEAQLEAELETLRYAERIVQSAGRSVSKLCEADVNAADLLAEALRDLETAGRYNKTLEALASELAEALSSVQAISGEVSSFLSDFEAEPGRLETLEARVTHIEKLKLKYGESIEAILEFRQEAGQELELLTNAEANLSELEARHKGLEEDLRKSAAVLTKARTKASEKLTKEVTTEIRGLGMANAQFSVEVTPQETLTTSGMDKITFLFSANLGEPPAPLSAVASGGELSRVMLGLNVVTGTDMPTLIFDEVDAGIGGSTGRAVGALLKRLAKNRQVLVVTHLAQVAAFADTQFKVHKLEQDGRTVTRVSQLGSDEREAELARMLSGAVTETAIAHARELLRDVQVAVAS